eukprot:2503924-Ditylum_brightwellii.AAC.1
MVVEEPGEMLYTHFLLWSWSLRWSKALAVVDCSRKVMSDGLSVSAGSMPSVDKARRSMLPVLSLSLAAPFLDDADDDERLL